MKQVLILCLFSIFSFAVFGQDDAKSILDKSAGKIKSYAAIEVDFDLTMENVEENIKETHTGKAYVKGMMYKLEIMDVINYFNGKEMYSYMPEVEEVNIKLPSEEDEELLNPATLFDLHNNNFKQKLVSKESSIAYIELYPNEKDKNFTKIGVWIDTAKNNIQKITSFGKDGNNLIISIKALTQPTVIPNDSFFTFNASQYPNVEIIDMR